MKIGTKSILWGAHAFWLHPWMVALAWWRLYGFPWDPRLWVAFWVHDLGYWGCPNMDGEEGEQHVRLGAKMMGDWFDSDVVMPTHRARVVGGVMDYVWGNRPQGCSWHCFSFYHSRFMAKRYGASITRLCVADKLACCLEPWWLYLPRAWASGELREYTTAHRARGGKYVDHGAQPEFSGARDWFEKVKAYLLSWVKENREKVEQEIWDKQIAMIKKEGELDAFLFADRQRRG